MIWNLWIASLWILDSMIQMLLHNNLEYKERQLCAFIHVLHSFASEYIYLDLKDQRNIANNFLF